MTIGVPGGLARCFGDIAAVQRKTAGQMALERLHSRFGQAASSAAVEPLAIRLIQVHPRSMILMPRLLPHGYRFASGGDRGSAGTPYLLATNTIRWLMVAGTI